MPHFTKQLQTQSGVKTFYFNRIFTVNGIKFHVSVKGDFSTHYFMMHERNGSWFISDAPMPPSWIVEIEKELEAAILEHLKEG